MLGSFSLGSIGSFVVSGDSPDEFLWDLFDQVVSDGSQAANVGGMTVNINNSEGYSQDYAERLDARGSAEWVQAHSNYFCQKIAGGAMLFSVTMPPDLFFNLHKVSLLGTVVGEAGSNGRDNVRRNNIAMYKHGYGTQEYFDALKAIPWHDYPYSDLESISLINYLIIKGILSIRTSGNIKIITPSEVEAINQERLKSSLFLLEEQKRLSAESRSREKKKRNPKVAKK